MDLSFAVLVLFTITAAFVAVTTRNIVHAALALGFCFFGVAGFYLLLEAPFIAAAQVLIYVGAITVLILFAIMLTARTLVREPRGSLEWKMIAAAVALVLFGGVLVPTLRLVRWPISAEPMQDSLTYLSHGLLQTYLLPFEVASVLLLAALVGAIVLAKEERTDP
jgi:NADH:ubiquinone oxidoreductase subunit 6 (subunit J)